VAASELEQAATVFATSGLRAAATHARGAILHAQSRPAEALSPLRDSLASCQEMNATFEGAHIRASAAPRRRRRGVIRCCCCRW
jgi:hypothetical protein